MFSRTAVRHPKNSKPPVTGAGDAAPSLQAHRDLRRTAPDEPSFFDRIGVDDRLIARTRYQLQFDLPLQELDASKLLHANSILGAGLPDILQCGDQIGIAFGVRALPGQYVHMTALRIELERGQLARTRSLRGQLGAECIQDFRRLKVHRPSSSSSL